MAKALILNYFEARTRI